MVPRKYSIVRILAALAALSALPASLAVAQPQQPPVIAGDAPAEAPPLAKDLSPAFRRADVAHAMRKVADWQLAQAQPHWSQDWTYAALYAGFMAVPPAVAGTRYQDAMLAMSRHFHWQPGPRETHADDQAIGQTYLALYRIHHDPAMIAPIRARWDAVMKLPDNPAKPLWWWCDALFMAPPALAELSRATGDPAYLTFMDRQWAITSGLLYDPAHHLFYRDATFLHAQEKNGQPIFWSRGNGWVMAGLVRVIEAMPKNDPRRAKYVRQLQQMASAIVPLQGADGLWRPGLLDPAAYPLPENSGSAFIAYALAYGVRTHLLDRARYLPPVHRAWAGLLSHVYADGRLGCIQPIGAAPGAYTPTASYVYGVGAFLLAGSEIYRLSR